MVKVNFNQHSFVNVTAKFKNSYLLNEDKNKQSEGKAPEVYSHMLVARLKDSIGSKSPIMFSYIVKVSIIEGDDPNAGMM